MNNYKERIRAYIEAHLSEMVEALKELVAIPSVAGAPAPGAPYGKDCADLLLAVKTLYEKYGFEANLYDEDGYLLTEFGNGEHSIGMFAHGDVVPPGDGWLYAAPFCLVEKHGCLFGRGALDNKVAIINSLFCARIIRDLNIPVKSRLVLFTGSNEETGMRDVMAYRQKHVAPDFSFVCDAGFPLYRGDKGILRFTVTQREPMITVTDICGGEAFNIIVGNARAVVNGEALEAKGISAHAAVPDGAINAVGVLSEKLLERADVAEQDKDALRLICSLTQTCHGDPIGIAVEDPDFGPLTLANGIVTMTDGRITLGFDMRYGLAVDIDSVIGKIKAFFYKYGWDMTVVYDTRPFALSEEDPCLRACLDAYHAFTGNYGARPRINAGGTYAKHLPRAIEIGTTAKYGVALPMPAGHGSSHQPDEFIRIDGIEEGLEITMQMILACDKVLAGEDNGDDI